MERGIPRPLPLQGIRVADFSWVVAAPTATQFLAELGAEVIRIESARRLDIMRDSRPHASGADGMDRSGGFHVHNLSKRSITLDLSQPAGRALALELVKVSDVAFENFATGVLERLGLGYDALRAKRPDLVFLSNSGLGRTGPHRDFVAFGIVLMALGLASITGHADGPPGVTEPMWTDYVAGMYGLFAALATLYHRRRTGQGQYIDLSMTEAQVSFLPEGVLEYTMRGRTAGRMGNRDRYGAPHGCYPCAGNDQWVAIGVSTEDEWHRFCRVIDRPAWCDDPRFADSLSRFQHQDELDALIAQWTREFSAMEVTEVLQHAGVPAGPSLNPADLLADAHLRARDTFVAPQHPVAGARAQPGLPWRMEAHSNIRYGPSPSLGQDNAYVFHELLGLSEGEVMELQAAKILA